MHHKTCHRCGKIKELETEFYKDRGTLDGYHERCKECIESAYPNRGKRRKRFIPQGEAIVIEGDVISWSDQ